MKGECVLIIIRIHSLNNSKLKTQNSDHMAVKSTWWDKLLKIVIAVASAVLGAFGAQAMPA